MSRRRRKKRGVQSLGLGVSTTGSDGSGLGIGTPHASLVTSTLGTARNASPTQSLKKNISSGFINIPYIEYCGSDCRAVTLSPRKDRAIVGGREVLRLLKIDHEKNSITTERNLKGKRGGKLTYSAFDVHYHPSDGMS